jgi:phosphoribosylaminoimidazole-succinocarboxamide synthase
MTSSLLSTLPLPLFIRGKVRDVYDLDDRLLMVASDRISAFDYVLPTPIPDKGKILTQLSVFWFNQLSAIAPHHLITANAQQFPPTLAPYRAQLDSRTMLVKKTDKFPIECVVRGYLAGSGWNLRRDAAGRTPGVGPLAGAGLYARDQRRTWET